MNEKALQLIEDLEEASQTALLLSKRCATLAGHAAKLLESQPTAPNSASDAIAILRQAIEGLTCGIVRDQLLIRLDAVSQQRTLP